MQNEVIIFVCLDEASDLFLPDPEVCRRLFNRKKRLPLLEPCRHGLPIQLGTVPVLSLQHGRDPLQLLLYRPQFRSRFPGLIHLSKKEIIHRNLKICCNIDQQIYGASPCTALYPPQMAVRYIQCFCQFFLCQFITLAKLSDPGPAGFCIKAYYLSSGI